MGEPSLFGDLRSPARLAAEAAGIAPRSDRSAPHKPAPTAGQLAPPSTSPAAPSSTSPALVARTFDAEAFAYLFLRDLAQLGPGTPSGTRQRYAIAGGNDVGPIVRRLARKKYIALDAIRTAANPAAHGSLRRGYCITDSGREVLRRLHARRARP